MPGSGLYGCLLLLVKWMMSLHEVYKILWVVLLNIIYLHKRVMFFHISTGSDEPRVADFLPL